MDDAEHIPFISRSQLVADLQRLGVRAGDTVMLHAAVSAIGWIVGGPRVVLDALLDVLGSTGTVMMLASWEGNPYEMDEWTPAEQQMWLAECPAFDPQTSPADHREMSILAEYLRTWPGAQRSRHPLASFVAVGRRAEWLTENHQLNYGLGADSPLARLCEADGRVLTLGASFSNLTLVHHAEHLADLPEKAIDRYRMPIVQDGKTVWVEIEEFDTTEGIADFGCEDYFLEIGRAFVVAGQAQSGKVGGAQAHLLPANALKEFAVAWMKTHYIHPE